MRVCVCVAVREINDYAKKEWGGLVRDYYSKRWELLLSMANHTLTTKTSWDQGAYGKAVFEQVESVWSNATSPSFPIEPEHDLLQIIDALFAKYGV